MRQAAWLHPRAPLLSMLPDPELVEQVLQAALEQAVKRPGQGQGSLPGDASSITGAMRDVALRAEQVGPCLSCQTTDGPIVKMQPAPS